VRLGGDFMKTATRIAPFRNRRLRAI